MSISVNCSLFVSQNHLSSAKTSACLITGQQPPSLHAIPASHNSPHLSHAHTKPPSIIILHPLPLDLIRSSLAPLPLLFQGKTNPFTTKPTHFLCPALNQIVVKTQKSSNYGTQTDTSDCISPQCSPMHEWTRL